MPDDETQTLDRNEGPRRDVTHTTEELGEVARRQARAAGDELRAAGEEKFVRGRDQLSDRVDDAASAVDHAAEDLRQRGEPQMADWIQRGAEELQHLAESIRRQDIETLTRRSSRMASQSPALYLGGTVIAGVLLGRLLRSA